MTKLQVFWYLSEAGILAMYITFLAVMSNSIWFGIAGGIAIVVFQKIISRALDKVKVEK